MIPMPARAHYYVAIFVVVGCLALGVWLVTRGTVEHAQDASALAPHVHAPPVGAVCQARPQDNPTPWPLEPPTWSVEVLDVEHGWVRYKLLTADVHEAERFRDMRIMVEGFAERYVCEEHTP
jgi:hypothetical protein